MPGEIKTLEQLNPHQHGLVQPLEAENEELDRLKSMGVCEGRVVELIQVGDPLIVKVYGTRVGVSARLARKIKVQACESNYCALKKVKQV